MKLLTENIWNEIQNSVSENMQNFVAVAYFGMGGADLLPLKQGDVLIVDASLHQIQAGLVDPRELLKLEKVGVKIFTYPQLHAKVYALGDMLFVGSSNVSENSRKNLKEAVLQTDDPKMVNEAKNWIESLAFSPLYEDYINELKKYYKPPRTFNSNFVVEKCLYLVFVDFNSYYSNGYQEPLKKGEEEMEALIPDISKKEYEYFEFPSLPEFAIGDYLLIHSKNSEGEDMINKPCRVLHIQPWGFDNKYFVFYSKPKGKRQQIKKMTIKIKKNDGFLTLKKTNEIMEYWNLSFNDL